MERSTKTVSVFYPHLYYNYSLILNFCQICSYQHALMFLLIIPSFKQYSDCFEANLNIKPK